MRCPEAQTTRSVENPLWGFPASPLEDELAGIDARHGRSMRPLADSKQDRRRDAPIVDLKAAEAGRDRLASDGLTGALRPVRRP